MQVERKSNDYRLGRDFNGQGKIEYYVGRNTYIGSVVDREDSFLDAGFENAVHLGRYTSLGSYISFIRDDENTPYIYIGNDCWIGDRAEIYGGVTIGDGAVIAAGAVVKEDVPPYAIVGGEPLKLIGYRFSQDIVERMLSIKWWNWDIEKIVAAADDMRGEPRNFAYKYCKNL